MGDGHAVASHEVKWSTGIGGQGKAVTSTVATSVAVSLL